MILVALGSNLPGPHGTPAQALRAALRILERDLLIQRVSRFWLTAPVPASDQPWYHNAVISIETALDPRALIAFLKDTELAFGRSSSVRNAPRVLDLDLIAYHDEVINTPGLVLPHPRMQERAFVLLPLQEVAPHWVHPVLKRPVDELVKTMPPGQVASAIEEHA